jgi:hypothetical protein
MEIEDEVRVEMRRNELSDEIGDEWEATGESEERSSVEPQRPTRDHLDPTPHTRRVTYTGTSVSLPQSLLTFLSCLSFSEQASSRRVDLPTATANRIVLGPSCC